VLLLNQTAFENYPWKWAMGKILEYSCMMSARRPSLCGFRDGYGFLIDEHPTGGNHGHVSCFMAMMNMHALGLLDALHASCKAVAPGEEVSESQFEAMPLSTKMKDFCSLFTRSRSTHFNWSPPSGVQGEALEALLRRKSMGLLMEFELSARVSKAEGFLVDVGHSTMNKVLFLILRKLGAWITKRS